MTKAKLKTVGSTPFSDFIRNASSAEKMRVYTAIMKKVSEDQNRILARFEAVLRARDQSTK